MNILKIHIYLVVFLVLSNLFTDNFSTKQFSNTTVSNEQSFGCCKNKTVYNRSDFYIATSTAQAGVHEPANHTFVPNAPVDMGGNHMFMENGWVNGQYISGSKTIKYMYMENECQDLLDIGGSKTFKHMYAVNGAIDMGGSESVNYRYNKCWYNNDGSKTTEFKNELHEKIRSLPNTQIKLYGL